MENISVCVVEDNKDIRQALEQIIMMTDGYPGGSWGDELYCETLFLIHGDPGRHLVAPFGMTAWYEPDRHSPQNKR